MTGPIAGREFGTVARTGGGTRELGNRCQTRVPESNPGDEAAGFGVNQYDSVATRGNLLAALVRSPAAVGLMHGDGDREQRVVASPDGRLVATGDNDGTEFHRARGRANTGLERPPGGSEVTARTIGSL